VRANLRIAVAGVLCGAVLAAGCTAGSHGAGGRASKADRDVGWATVSSVTAGGGMRALIAAARKEGRLNVIALPPRWANYAAIIKAFRARYGIAVHDADPDGVSKDELAAVQKQRSSPSAPDVLDLSTPAAIKASRLGLLASYKVAEWYDIPVTEKAVDGTWYAGYGGYLAIGYDSRKVKVAPASFSDLRKPIYKHEVSLSGDPATSGAALAAVYAASLASGGSLGNIGPGVAYFARLRKDGNFVTAPASLARIRDGHAPIVVGWDYVLASIARHVPGFRIVIPADATYASYHDQAISKDAPDPAAARLWEEFLYSAAGQNLWLAARIRPAELPTMLAEGTAGAGAHALPPVPAAPPRFPTPAELAKAAALVARQWAAKVIR
jgi:putative spermidine/putrescine transport system substrate-binding protein